MKLFLAIPSADAKVSIHTMSAFLRTQSELLKHRISMSIHTLNYAEISVARNVLTAWFVKSDCSHLLFCDDDISFEPQVIGDMISANARFVAAGCVKREVDLEKYAAARKPCESKPEDEENRREALRAATRVNYAPVRPVNRRGGVIEATQTGLGLALLRRDVFEVMLAADAAAPLSYRKDWVGEGVYGYFDRIRIEEARSTLSEDYSFCRRWRQCGGRIWVLEGAHTRHHGEFAFQNW